MGTAFLNKYFNFSGIRFALLFAALLALAGCASLLKPKLKQQLVEIKAGDYFLDTDHASVLFKVDHLGYSNFVGRFNSFQAELNYDNQVIENATLQAVMDMASVDVNNEKFERALRGRFWFDVENYPQATFATTSAEKLTDNKVIFRGPLTFLGIEKEIEVLVTVNGAGNNMITGKYTLGFSASATISRSDFGLDRFVPAVGDDVQLEIEAEFQRRRASKKGGSDDK